VADNLSDDTTRWILDELADIDERVRIIDDPDPQLYDQAGKMTRLVHMAGAEGARWVLPSDADELVVGTWPGGTLAEFFAECSVDVLTATGWDHVATHDDEVHDPESDHSDPVASPVPAEDGESCVPLPPGSGT